MNKNQKVKTRSLGYDRAELHSVPIQNIKQRKTTTLKSCGFLFRFACRFAPSSQ